MLLKQTLNQPMMLQREAVQDEPVSELAKERDKEWG
jgi:hypothetical protein